MRLLVLLSITTVPWAELLDPMWNACVLQIYGANLKCTARLTCFSWKDWEKERMSALFINIFGSFGLFVVGCMTYSYSNKVKVSALFNYLFILILRHPCLLGKVFGKFSWKKKKSPNTLPSVHIYIHLGCIICSIQIIY